MGFTTGVRMRAFFIVLFLAMAGAMAELLLVRGYTSCFNLLARWAIQVAAEYSIYAFVLASWFAYKESSRIKGAIFMCSIFLLGSLPSMAYIILQFYTLSPEEFSKDPIYFVLARRHKRDGIKGPSVIAARILFCVLACYMVGVLTYTIVMDIFHTPTINKCLISNVIDIYVHFAAISAWVAYKESSRTSAFVWILFIILFRGIIVCVYIARQLFFLSPDQPVSLIIFNDKNRDLQGTDPLLMAHPSE